MWLPTHWAELKWVIERHPDAGLVSTNLLEVPNEELSGVEEVTGPAPIRRIDYFLEAPRRIDIIHFSTTAAARRAFEEDGSFAKYRAGEDLEY